MKISALLPQELKRIIQIFMSARKYDVTFGKGAATDLRTRFEGKNVVNDYAGVFSSVVGFGTYISGHTRINKAKIGRFCSIGRFVKNNFGVHPSSGFVSTHPSFFSTKKQAGFTFVDKDLFQEHSYVDPDHRYLIEIGNDVWIGNNVAIMDGVRIGDGAIIAMNAVVTKDVEPYTIVGGLPAKTIKKRFDVETIERLMEFRWWDKDFEWLQHNSHLFADVDAFITHFSRSGK